MASFQKDTQGYSKDLFGGVYEKNFDIFQQTETPTQSRFAHLKHLNTNSPDRRSSYDENSPRRTPVQKPADLFGNGSEPLSVAAINQRFHTLEQAQQKPPSSPSLGNVSLSFTNKTTTDATRGSNTAQPSWFNNPKKRIVPSQVIKREDYEEVDPESSFLISSKSPNTKTTKGKSTFKTMTFGTRKTSSQDANSHVSSLQDELPPTRTLQDLANEDNISSPLGHHHRQQLHRQGSADSSMTSTSLSKPNSSASNNSMRFAFQPPRHTQLDLELHKQQDQQTNPKYTQLPDTSNESAILVFGYPESIANQIIRHFSKFGDILEDFEAIRTDSLFFQRSSSSTKRKAYPISTGNGWIRLTYANKASSIRALEESGESVHGCMIGCVPFSKLNMERIQSGDLDLKNFNNTVDEPNNDEYLDFVSHFKKNKIVLKNDDKIFVKSGGKNKGEKELGKLRELKRQGGWVGYVNNLLFGWDDL